jgi:hypothetical protein
MIAVEHMENSNLNKLGFVDEYDPRYKTTRQILKFGSRLQRPAIQSTITIDKNESRDTRTALASGLFDKVPIGRHCIIHKTVRAGVTYSVTSESVNRNEPIVCLVPTNKIAEETKGGLKTYINNPLAKIVRIRSNKECVLNTLKIQSFPDLNELPTMPLPSECGVGCVYYSECQNMNIFKISDPDVIIMTHHKAEALTLSEHSSPISSEILSILRSRGKNVLFDECHRLEREERVDITVLKYNVDTAEQFIENVEKYKIIPDEFEKIHEVIELFDCLISNTNVLTAESRVLECAKDENYFKRHMNVLLETKDYIDVKKTGKEKLISQKIFEELIELMINRTKYDLTVKDVLLIYKMISLVTASKISVCSVRINKIIRINIAASDDTHRRAIASFLTSMQYGRRIILSSGTIGSYDYGRLFYNHEKPSPVMWGKRGDQLNTNSKLMILADTFKIGSYGRYSLSEMKSKIIDRVIKILSNFPHTKIIAMSAKDAGVIKEELKTRNITLDKDQIDYYNSSDSIGVSSDYRSIIIIGLAYKPSNTYDPSTDNAEESFKMWNEAVHADTWQAIGRVKDPNGKIPSVVFAIGVNVEDCFKVSMWGKGRTIDVIHGGKYRRAEVVLKSSVTDHITAPMIIKCEDVDMMIHKAKKHVLTK